MNSANDIVASVTNARVNAIENLKAERSRLIDERDKAIESNKATMNSIANSLSEIEKGLSNLDVKVRTGKRHSKASNRKAPSPREHNDTNLVDAVASVLASGPKSIKDILSSINYKSNSPNFRSIVQQTFTRHSVTFSRNGNVKTNSEGPVSKTGDRGMFVRIGRGAYAVYSDGMTAQDVKSMSDNWVSSHSE